MTEEGTFCYTRMPFGLKKCRETYQRLGNKMFKKQIERKIKVYIDNMMVKNKVIKDHVYDLEEVLIIIRHYEMHL